MNRAIVAIFKFFEQNKRLLVAMFAAIVVLLVWSVARVDFVEDISSFLPTNDNNKRVNEAYQKVGGANKIVVVISHKADTLDEMLLTDVATYFAQTLQEADTVGRIKDIFYEIDSEHVNKTTDFILQNLPIYLTDSDYRRIDSLITHNGIANQLEADKNILLSPMGAFMRNIVINDPMMLSSNTLKKLEVFRQNDHYNTDNGFVFNDRGECIVAIKSAHRSSETAENKLLALEIGKAIDLTRTEFGNKVELIPFGAALISISNAERIKADSMMAVGISGVVILVLLLWFFRSPKQLILIVLSIGFGALFSLGVIVMFKSTLSIIAIGIASIIFGIAINYPLHFLTHFKHVGSRLTTIKELINPLLIGNITTVGAFLSLLFISSDAMRDLGLFSSLLLIGTIIFVLIFLPHIIRDNKSAKHQHSSTKEPKGARLLLNKITNFSPENNNILVTIFVSATFLLLFFSTGAKFDANIHNINYMNAEQRSIMEYITSTSQKGNTIYIVAEGNTPQEALSRYEEKILPFLSNKNRISDKSDSLNISGIGAFFPTEKTQTERIERWNNFWKNRKELLMSQIKVQATRQGFVTGTFDGFDHILNKEYHPQPFAYFYDNLEGLAENYINIESDKTMIFTQITGNIEEAKATEIFNSDATYAFDNRSFMQKLVMALSDDFNRVLYICGIIVAIFLFFSFGRIELATITFLPLAVSWIWILGLMNIFDIQFNIVNIILATFIFGQGDDYTIFITEGLIYEYTYGRKMLARFKTSILLSATILFVAIGTLIFAQHPAMKSLAELTIVGMTAVVICAYTIPPLIYKWLVYRRNGKQRIMPITLWNSAKTIFSFLVFIVSAILMTIIGFFLLTIGGKNRRNKDIFHRILCKGFRFLATMMPQVKHYVHNRYDETFDKPAIIVANHQSHLDLLYILMLSPKIVVLTNSWVWHNPFYGAIIRYADFVPVANGIEANIDRLKKLTDEGYSILIFPEGSRSADCSIGRFRKGAFYLAQHLKLDIVPVIIHGIGHILPKDEFLLRKGRVDIVVEERINVYDIDEKTAYGTLESTNQELQLLSLSKDVRKIFIDKYEEISQKVETPDYFADKVLKNYIYKGRDIARTAHKELRGHNNFAQIVAQLPDKGTILVTNCRQGTLPLMIALVKSRLQVTATDPNIDLLDIARNCGSVPPNLHYVDTPPASANYTHTIDFSTL